MILFNIQNENDEIVCLQNKKINNNATQTKHANKLEPKLTELARTKSEHNCTDKRYKTENNYTDKRYCDAIVRTKPNHLYTLFTFSDVLTKRAAWCKKSKGRPLFSVLKKR